MIFPLNLSTSMLVASTGVCGRLTRAHQWACVGSKKIDGFQAEGRKQTISRSQFSLISKLEKRYLHLNCSIHSGPPQKRVAARGGYHESQL